MPFMISIYLLPNWFRGMGIVGLMGVKGLVVLIGMMSQLGSSS